MERYLEILVCCLISHLFRDVIEVWSERKEHEPNNNSHKKS